MPRLEPVLAHVLSLIAKADGGTYQQFTPMFVDQSESPVFVEPDFDAALELQPGVMAELSLRGYLEIEPPGSSSDGFGPFRITGTGLAAANHIDTKAPAVDPKSAETAPPSTAGTAVPADALALLSRWPLHDAIAHEVLAALGRDDAEHAVFFAYREVEVRARKAGGFGNDVFGAKIVDRAFGVGTGTLTDTESEPGEQAGVFSLFKGGLLTFKNPSSHRRVEYDDAAQLAEVLLFADLLLRRIDRAAART